MGGTSTGIGAMVTLNHTMISGVAKTFKVWWLQVITLMVNFGFAGLMYVHFFKEDIHIAELFLAECIFHIFLFFIILLKGTFSTRFDIRLGYVVGLLAFSLLFLPFSRPLMYAYFVLRGIAGIIFYIPYNILYFGAVKKEERVQSITFYWLIGLSVSVIAPLVGGALIQWFGFPVFIIGALTFLGIGIGLTRYVPSVTHAYSVKDVLKHISRVRLIALVDGALHKVIGITTPVFALYYLQTEWAYGRLLAVFGLISGLVSFLLARHLDKTNHRMRYLWPLTLSMVIITGAFYFIESFSGFLLCIVLLQVVTVMTEPLRGNVLQDVFPPSPLVWISRELYLTIGRMILFGLAALFLFIGLKKELFLLFASLNLLFPLLLVYKKIYASTH